MTGEDGITIEPLREIAIFAMLVDPMIILRGAIKEIEYNIMPYPGLPAIYDPEGPHYRRGYGPVWPSAFWSMRRPSEGIEYMGDWAGRHTSFPLSKGWGITEQAASTMITIGNKSPYSPGVLSEEKQLPIHHETGWPTDEWAVEKAAQSGRIHRAIQNELNRAAAQSKKMG